MKNPPVTLLSEHTFLVFDLDDTLYQEIDYLKSGYRHILKTMLPDLPADTAVRMLRKYQAGENVFEWLTAAYAATYAGLSVPALLQAYREHLPDITLSDETRAFLAQVKERGMPAGLITDGRSISQRAKLQA